MDFLNRINNAKKRLSSAVNEKTYYLSKDIRHLTYPLRDYVYKKKNGFSMSDTWECGDAIINSVLEISKLFNEDYYKVFLSYSKCYCSDIYLMADSNFDKEIGFYNKSKEVFLDKWDSFGKELIATKEQPFLDVISHIGKLLEKYQEENIGFPCYYVENHFHMIDDVDKFGDQKVSFIYFNDEYRDSNGVHKTNKELGIDYTLFNMDIIEAKQALNNYIDWNKKDGDLSMRESFEVLDEEESRRLDTSIDEEALKAWHWIGDNIRDLWE